MSNKIFKKCLTRTTKYDIIITQGSTNKKGSEQMSENEKIAEFFADVLKAGEDDQMYRFIAAISELDENDWNAIRKLAEKLVKK
jgi:hypothetical protein